MPHKLNMYANRSSLSIFDLNNSTTFCTSVKNFPLVTLFHNEIKLTAQTFLIMPYIKGIIAVIAVLFVTIASIVRLFRFKMFMR